MAFAYLRRRRAPLHTFAAMLSVFVAANAWAQTPAAVSADMKRLLDANAWQLEYQLSFKASSSGAGQSLTGPVTYQTVLNFDATETLVIDSRSQGASLSMQKVMANASNPAAAASMQKALMDIVMQSDNIASWMMTGGGLSALGEEPTLEQLQAAATAAARKSIGTMTVDYSAETRGDKLVNETGSAYKQTVRTTRRGTGGVSQGAQQITVEVNGATKRLLMILPSMVPLVLDSTLTEEIVTTTELPPGSNPSVERKTSTQALENFPRQITVTDATQAFGSGSGLMIDDPIVMQSGKISGQHTMTATYINSGAPVSGTLAVKYTLTPR